jgi:ribonuclease HI
VSAPLPPFLLIHIDGGSRGNPGEAGFGVWITTPNGQFEKGLYGYLKWATNNVAEYQALVHALDFSRAGGAHFLKIFSDSELVVRQINGKYRVKHPDMIPLYRKAKGLMTHFKEVSLEHIPREQNTEADRLANRAMDEKASRLE